MNPSAKIEAFIQGYEKCRLHAFLPTPNDHWTCGWGATGFDIGPTTTWTQQEADDRFDKDICRFGGGVFLLLHDATSQAQYDAMVSLAYNVGLGAFAHSTVLKLHNAGDHTGAAAAFAMWNKQDGVVLDGLTRRRQAEADIYRAGS